MVSETSRKDKSRNYQTQWYKYITSMDRNRLAKTVLKVGRQETRKQGRKIKETRLQRVENNSNNEIKR